MCANVTSATQTVHESIAIVLVGVTAPGTYTVDMSTNTTIGYTENHSPNESWDTGDCSGATGNIVVTSISDAKVEGTFTFTGAHQADDCSKMLSTLQKVNLEELSNTL